MIAVETREKQFQKIVDAWARALAPTPKQTCSEWVEKNITLPARFPGNYNGPFRLDRAPYARAWYDAVSDRNVRRVSICSTTQCGKTLFLSNTAAYAICADPGPILFIFPTEAFAESFSEDRLELILDGSPEVCKHRLPDESKNKRLEKFFDSCTLRLVGNNSENALVGRPVRWLIMDEVDLYDAGSERRRATVDLAFERIKTFWNHKVVACSTPSTPLGNIWQFYLKGTQETFHVKCAHCPEMQTLEFENLKFGHCRVDDGKWNLDRVLTETYYECRACKGRLYDRDKSEMLKRGEWRAKHPEIKNHRSFQLNGLYPQWTPFGKVAVDFLESKDHFSSFMSFRQNSLALPWEPPVEAQAKPDEITKHIDQYPEGFCKENPRACLITCDVQHSCLFYVIRAWGENDQSWLVKYGSVPDFDSLIRVSQLQFSCPSGRFGISHGFIDSGDGGKTKEVYDFCRRSRFIPWKGQPSSHSTGLYKWGDVDGIKLLNMNVDHWKDALQHKILTPQGWHLHGATGQDYINQMTSEVAVEYTDAWGNKKRRWKRVKTDNHYWDCEVAQLCASAVLDLRFTQGSHLQIIPTDQKPSAPKQKESGKAPWESQSYIDATGGFLNEPGRNHWDL